MKSIVVSLGVLTATGFSWLSWSQLRQPAGEALTTKATEALVENGIEGVDVKFTNLDGVVTGADTPVLQDQVREIVLASIPTGRITFAEPSPDSIDQNESDEEPLADAGEESSADVSEDESDDGIEYLSFDEDPEEESGELTTSEPETEESEIESWGDEEADLASALALEETEEESSAAVETDGGLEEDNGSSADDMEKLVDSEPFEVARPLEDGWSTSLTGEDKGWSDNLADAEPLNAGVRDVPAPPSQASTIGSDDGWSDSGWGDEPDASLTTAEEPGSSEPPAASVTGLGDETNIMTSEATEIASAESIEMPSDVVSEEAPGQHTTPEGDIDIEVTSESSDPAQVVESIESVGDETPETRTELSSTVPAGDAEPSEEGELTDGGIVRGEPVC